ncbi:MAG: endonuclease/exonuclease/phosphatase family protein [Thermoguttaceae bacterium]|nr:endonuclease/exonuclease/phosphatase family protein [Thermoguttaceae bacterium]
MKKKKFTAFFLLVLGMTLCFGELFAGTPETGDVSIRAEGTELRFMAANIWGDYFGNPVGPQQEGAFADVFRRYAPDIIALQEVTPNWWKSRLFTDLGPEWGTVRGKNANGVRNYVPMLYRKDRLTLLDEGSVLFHVKLDRSKGVTWAVFEVKATGKRFIAFSTHFWWKSTPESDPIRVENAKMILAELQKLQEIWKCPAIGGGDFNCRIGSNPMKHFAENGWVSAQEAAESASPECSHHGNPVRGEDGIYRGFPRRKGNVKANSIDHVLVEQNKFRVLTERVILDPDALGASDHSPIYADVAF